MSFKIYFSPKEISMAEQAGAFRSQLARASGVKNQRIDTTRSDQEIDINGVKAEMAVAKLYQIDYDPFHFGIDSGVDLWSGETSIDVKSTFHPHGHLVFKSLDSFKADVAMLCVIRENVVKVVGGCEKHWFMENHVNRAFSRNKKDAYPSLTQGDLEPVDKIWNLLTHARLY